MIETNEPKDNSLERIVSELDNEFRVTETIDPAMSRFVPMVYDPTDITGKKNLNLILLNTLMD